MPAILVTPHLCLHAASITLIIMEQGTIYWRRKKTPPTQEHSFLIDSPLNRSNSLGNPAGVHMLLITVGYLVPQDDMLLNGVLMVIGSFLSLSALMSFTSLLLMPCRYLATGQMRCYKFSCFQSFAIQMQPAQPVAREYVANHIIM